MSYIAKALGLGQEPTQLEKKRKDQVQNNAGGFVFKVSDLTYLRRFLCLGTEKGTYYVKEQKLTLEAAQNVMRMVKEGKGLEVVNEVKDYSLQGRTAKQDPILFCLAICVRFGDAETRKAAYSSITQICRIPTFLFTFVEFCQTIAASEGTGWGRAMRREISNWYNSRPAKSLAFTATKYKNRNGWTHRDILRLAHVKPIDEAHNVVFRYILQGAESLETSKTKVQELESNLVLDQITDALEDYELVDLEDGEEEVEGVKVLGDNMEAEPEEEDETKKKINIAVQSRKTLEWLESLEEAMKIPLEQPEELCKAIKKLRLAREHIPTQFLNELSIWEVLLENMPITAMIRNLGKMSAIGLFSSETKGLKNPSTYYVSKVTDKLKSVDVLKKGRVHPFNILVAMRTYANGRGDKGKLTWTPNPQITQGLEKAFYLSFQAVEPTNQRVIIGLDVSGSMCSSILGSESVTCRDGSMAMAMVTMKNEPMCKMMAFCDRFVPLQGVSKDNTLDQNLRAISSLPFGSTDCAQPMIWALENKIEADCFMIFTDNETWAGKVHPFQALQNYRNKMKIPQAKLIVVGMSVSDFSIADPNDPGMLDVAGFDANAPGVMRNFMMGLLS